jgi:hypothetical protein
MLPETYWQKSSMLSNKMSLMNGVYWAKLSLFLVPLWGTTARQTATPSLSLTSGQQVGMYLDTLSKRCQSRKGIKISERENSYNLTYS